MPKMNKINIYSNNVCGVLIVCCLISTPKVSRWLAHDFECLSDVKGVVQDSFLHSSECLSVPIQARIQDFEMGGEFL